MWRPRPAEFHSLWNTGKEDTTLKFIREDNIKLTQARIALISGVATIITAGLNLLGIEVGLYPPSI